MLNVRKGAATTFIEYPCHYIFMNRIISSFLHTSHPDVAVATTATIKLLYSLFENDDIMIM